MRADESNETNEGSIMKKLSHINVEIIVILFHNNLLLSVYRNWFMSNNRKCVIFVGGLVFGFICQVEYITFEPFSEFKEMTVQNI